jgi:hypothetical protein
MVTFKTVLHADPTGTGTFIRVPPDVQARLGLTGRPKINSMIAGNPYRGSLMPMGDGSYCLGVLKSIQEAAGVRRGDTVTVGLELDTAPRVVEMPAEIRKAIAGDNKAQAAWDRLSFTSKKEMARSLEDAKRPETRERRLDAAVKSLRG